MKSIIVATDFSDASMNAAYYAASLANIFGAELVLAHAYSNPLAIDKMDMHLMAKTGKELQEVLEDFLEQHIEVLRRKFTVKISGIVREGSTLRTLEDMVDSLKADLLVMGMKGKDQSSSVLGSTVARILPRVSIPVLVIPMDARFESINVITLASDFDEDKDAANYRLLTLFAQQFQALVQIVNVQKRGREINIPQRESKLNLEKIFSDTEHKFFSVEDDEVDEGIEDFLEQHPSQLLVMLARRQNVMRRFFGKVHTRKMAYETEIPLLVLQG